MWCPMALQSLAWLPHIPERAVVGPVVLQHFMERQLFTCKHWSAS